VVAVVTARTAWLRIYKWNGEWELWHESEPAPGIRVSRHVAASNEWPVLMSLATGDPAYLRSSYIGRSDQP
jgi:hypothetical protein